MAIGFGGTARRFALTTSAAIAAATLVAPAHAGVIPADSFNFDIEGCDSSNTNCYFLAGATGPLTGIFGTTTTFATGGSAGQSISISGIETITGTTTTDTFRITTPTNFLASATINGTTISQMYFDIGLYASNATNTVNLALPITALTGSGKIVYGTGNSILTVTPVLTLGTGGLSYDGYAGVSTTGTAGLYQFGIHEFDIVATYANPVTPGVPEPASWAMMIAGFGLVGGAARRARRTVVFAA